MNRLPVTLVACPHCDHLISLRGDPPAASVSAALGAVVLSAARDYALADSQGAGEAALARLTSATNALVDHDLANGADVNPMIRDIRDWLPTLSEAEALVFGVVALRGLLKAPTPPSYTTLEDAYDTAASMVDDYRREIKRLEYNADRDAWIREHGSRRLKLILAEGYAHGSDAAYRDERLRRERPGWGWLEPKGKRLGTLSEPRNPPMAAFGVLSEARKSDEGAKLHYMELRVGINRERRYVATATYLGRVAVYPKLDC